MIDETKTTNKNLEHKKNMKLNHPQQENTLRIEIYISLRFVMWSNMVSILKDTSAAGSAMTANHPILPAIPWTKLPQGWPFES